MCGEQQYPASDLTDEKGSPPRVRGTAVSASVRARRLGITPACAGNSVTMLAEDWFNMDHPRVCGEQISSELRIGARVGSPPRVRGTETA